MPTLNIANPTRQDWIVQYRVGAPKTPEFETLRQFTVPSGGQIDLQLEPIHQAQLIGHLEQRHGARDAAEVHGRMVRFSGLIYRDMGQIETTEIQQAHEAEMQTREERSVTQAVRGALGFDKAARKPNQTRPGARITETTVEQELPRGVRRTGNEVAFNLSVDPEGRSDIALPVN